MPRSPAGRCIAGFACLGVQHIGQRYEHVNYNRCRHALTPRTVHSLSVHWPPSLGSAVSEIITDPLYRSLSLSRPDIMITVRSSSPSSFLSLSVCLSLFPCLYQSMSFSTLLFTVHDSFEEFRLTTAPVISFSASLHPVSYTHLTLPTNREV